MLSDQKTDNPTPRTTTNLLPYHYLATTLTLPYHYLATTLPLSYYYLITTNTRSKGTLKEDSYEYSTVNVK